MNSYRLWDKINSMHVDTKDVVMSLDGSHIWWDNTDSGEMDYEDNREDYKLEQSSGYTDKWGNQVFEGDIVKVFYSGNEDYIGIAKVYFKYGSFQLSGKIVDRITTDNLLFGYAEDYNGNLWENKVEVIGNINETPSFFNGC